MQGSPDFAVAFGDGIAQPVDSRHGRLAVVPAAQHILRFFKPLKPLFHCIGVVLACRKFSQVADFFGHDAQPVQGIGFELMQVIEPSSKLALVVVQLTVQICEAVRFSFGWRRFLQQAAAQHQQHPLRLTVSQRCPGTNMRQCALMINLFLQRHAQGAVLRLIKPLQHQRPGFFNKNVPVARGAQLLAEFTQRIFEFGHGVSLPISRLRESTRSHPQAPNSHAQLV